MRSPSELTAVFRSQGLKLTPQRQLLFRVLHGNVTHPSADALYLLASAHMPGIALRTVYQTLNDLAAMGELQQLTLGAGSSRFDPNVETHHHTICQRCGEVRDVYLTGDAHPQVQELAGFFVDSAAVVLHGTCAQCLAGDSTVKSDNRRNNTENST